MYVRMSKKRTSIIWKLSDEEFKQLVKTSKSMSELLRHFGMENKGGNYKTCKKRIDELKIDNSHFLSKTQSSNWTRRVSKEDFIKKLIEQSSYNRTHLKKYLLKFNIIKYECTKCKNNGVWENKKLTLQLEHKNGISNDNRIQNLTFLCPNCHSQTNTFAGRSLKKNKIKPSEINKNWRNEPKYKTRKVARPIKEELEKEIKTNTMVSLGKKYGVSDNAVRKWCKSYGIKLS